MNKQKDALANPYIELYIAFLLFIFLSVYIFTQLNNTPIFNGDEFITWSKAEFFSLSFFTSKRPFTTNLFYKLCNSNPQYAVIAQQLLHVLSWTTLGYAISHSLKNRCLSIILLIFCSISALWWNILGWTFIMRSESFTFSLFLMWFSLLILNFKFKNYFLFIALSTVTLFFSFTRDSVPYFLLFFIIAISVMMYVLNTKTWHYYKKSIIAYLAVIVIIFTLQNLSAKNARPYPRHTFNITNIFFQRILTDPFKNDWFQKRGMPQIPNSSKWENNWASGNDWIFFKDDCYKPFLRWIQNKSVGLYSLYLVKHPTYFFKSAFDNKNKILSYNLFSYTGWLPSKNNIVKIVSHLWYPMDTTLLMFVIIIVNLILFKHYKNKIRAIYIIPMLLLFLTLGLQAGNSESFNFIFLIISSFICAWTYKRKGSVLYLMPLTLILSSLFNGLFVYHADAMEVWRHSLMTVFGLALAYIFALAHIIDLIFTEIKFSDWIIKNKNAAAENITLKLTGNSTT